MSIKIGEKYIVIKKIGEGAFGSIFIGKNEITNEDIAIKIAESTNIMLLNEAKIYNLLQNIKGIPKMKLYGKEGKYNYLIIDLLDKSLEDYKKIYKSFSLKTVICIGIQIFNRIRDIHEMNIIHRDIKPDNIMTSKNNDLIYLIDFGLSKLYSKNNKHIICDSNKKIIGTEKYVSINMHNGLTPSRRDDLESIMYVLIYLLINELPWKNENNMLEIKRDISNLIYYNIPNEFISIINYIRSLTFCQKPDYNYIINILVNLYENNNYEIDNKYEWTIQ